jgi:methylmalonyl-CoA mutase cobalamin-binding subunit
VGARCSVCVFTLRPVSVTLLYAAGVTKPRYIRWADVCVIELGTATSLKEPAREDAMSMAELEVSPCVVALRTALEAGQAAASELAARRCLTATTDPAILETVVGDVARSLLPDAVRQADALRAAVRVLDRAWNQAQSAGDAGTFLLATLPGDGHDVERHLWSMLLRRRGFEVNDLAMRAPALIARQATSTTTAIGVHVFDTRAQLAVQSLVAHLLRRNRVEPDFKVPVLLGGPGVNEAFARWVAIPEGGEPYWGGIYYCEDGSEMLQVLKQIVLFEPPPPAHLHEHTTPVTEGACESCGGCPLAGGCDLLPEQA